ncbi:resolvase [Paracraurococcus ruber]|nr:resolvase [Paracraurococcus ruber]
MPYSRLGIASNPGAVASIMARQARAAQRAARLAPVIMELRANGAASLSQLAAGLEAKAIPAPRGGRWARSQVKRLLQRIEAPARS